jgi:hypothetical protein
LDPVPEFEVLSLKSSANVDFVVLRFPYQENRPIYAKGQIRGDRNQIHLDVGQIWIKPGGADTGSTGKRLVSSRQELLRLINIEPRVSHEVELRLQQLLPQIRLEERTRLSTGENVILPVFTATDAEFESYVEQLIVGEKINHLNVVLEKLRDRTILYVGVGYAFSNRVQAIAEILGNLAWVVVGLIVTVILGWQLVRIYEPANSS